MEKPRRMRTAAPFALGLAAAVAAQPIQTAPPRWSASDVQDLLQAVEDSEAEGLRPQDYGHGELVTALIAGTRDIDLLADRSALALAHDMNEGAAKAGERRDWHIARSPMNYAAWLNGALARHDLGASFVALLPTGRNYGELKAGLAECRAEESDCRRFRINLDRWRALPRRFGDRYLWVNLPAFRLDLIENGHVVSSHRIIVGKPSSRTPLFQAQATGVTINPWWNVPCSIVDESIGRLVRNRPAEAAKRGYVASRGAGGKLTVRQRPGPENALGRVKLEMANPYNVYIHDTPAKNLFASDVRAFSHGCLRTENPVDLVQALLGADRVTEIDSLLLSGKTKTLQLSEPVPVYIVYLTLEIGPTARDGLISYEDIYGRDSKGL